MRTDMRMMNEKGIAMPIALFLLLVMTSVSGLLYQMSTRSVRVAKSSEAVSETFHMAEAAMNDGIRRIAVESNLWREKPTLSSNPDGYTVYVPSTYASNNGIPTCTGSGCQRNMYPAGGGLVKNVGPIGGDGDSVETGFGVTEQLNLEEPQTADITYSGQRGWYQVERLDQVILDEQNLGGSLDNNPETGEGVTSVRFRLTGFAMKSLRNIFGRSVVVSVIEVPAV